MHFTFTYTSIPLQAVRPVQSLSACTTVHFTFTYTSTPPMGRTACAEPQCLYNDALYLFSSLSNNAEERSSHLLGGGSLNSRMVLMLCVPRSVWKLINSDQVLYR